MIRRMKSPIQLLLSRSAVLLLGLGGLLLVMIVNLPPLPASGAPLQQATPTGILAEPLGEANLRSGPGIEYDMLGTIYHGTRYAVFGQHEFVPWLLIEYPPAPDGQAWVFADLVTTSVPRIQIPVLTGTVVLSTPSTTPIVDGGPATADPSLQAAVTLIVQNEVNIRFGPGVEYPRIARLEPGKVYRVLSRHELYPWVLVDLPESPNGSGWVLLDVAEIQGDLNSLPIISTEQFSWPTLTPTPPYVITSQPPWQEPGTLDPVSTPVATPAAPNTTHPDIQALGDSVLDYLLAQGFAPEEDRVGSVFLLDLATGENFSLGSGVAYSGMSLIKIPILVTLYRQLSRPADTREAELIANTMVCSGNHTANAMLEEIGGGDPLVGAQQVTATMRELGLRDTFILAPFRLTENDPIYNVGTVETDADQTRTAPDTSNQVTPEDLGWLLGAIYQCGVQERGPLLETFPGEFTPAECRQMILAMSANKINVLSEAGIPLGTRDAHKHGWIDDTHGDAAIIFTPGGDFVLTQALFQPQWLPYDLSWPIMAETTRMVYNAFNPQAPLDAIHPATVDETCDLTGNPLLSELSASIVPPIE
jgi:uncharacterized protein YraI